MKKEELIIMGAVSCVSGLVGGLLGKFFASNELWKEHERLSNRLERADNTLKSMNDRAETITKNLNEQVDSAVRFVYDSEARNAFERRLKNVNIESLAENACRTEIHKVEDSVIRRRIQSEYQNQIRSVMQDELKEYFKTGIKSMIDVDIDTDFIRRTAKQYIKDVATDILEEEIRKSVRSYNIDGRIEDIIDDCDLEDVVEEYIESHPSKMQEVIRKSVTYILKDKLNNNFIERVIDAMQEEAE